MKRTATVILVLVAVLACGDWHSAASGAQVYRRDSEWVSTGFEQGSSAGNPVNDIWLYEYVTGGDGLAGADPWWRKPGTLMVWDDDWYGQGGVWDRGDNVNPPISQTGLTHTINPGNHEHAPRVSWIAPSDGFVNVSGLLTATWGGGATQDLEVVIARKNSTGGSTRLFSGTFQQGVTTSLPLTLDPGLQMVHVKQGESIVLTNRAVAVQGGWVPMNDSAMDILHGRPGGSLLGYWSFDDTSSPGEDSSGQGKHATISGAPQDSNVPAQLGGGSSLSFNLTGSGQSASMPITGPMDPFTLAFWINPASHTNYNQGLGAGGWSQFNFHTEASGGIYTGTNVGSRFTPGDLPGGTLELNTWQHFAFTFDNGVAAFYKNGTPIAFKTNMGLPDPWTVFNLTASLHGLVDDVAVWNGALGPKTVYAIAQGWVAPNDGYAQAVLNDNPLAYWRLDDAPGSTTARDLTGAHDGVYSGNVILGGSRPFLLGPDNDYAEFAGGSMRAGTLTGLRDNFSVEFWIHPDTHVNYNQTIGGDGGWGQFIFHTGNNGEVWVGTRCCGSADRFSLGAGTLELDKWQHFVFTFEEINDTQGLARFYKDGNLLAEGTHLKGAAWTGFNLMSNLDGLVDEVAVYDYALTLAQIQAHFHAAVPEPSSLALAALGLVGLAVCARRFRRGA